MALSDERNPKQGVAHALRSVRAALEYDKAQYALTKAYLRNQTQQLSNWKASCV